MIWMDLENVIKKIRKEVPERLINLSPDSCPGADLSKMMFNFMQVRCVLYGVLKDVELEIVEDRWNEHR